MARRAGTSQPVIARLEREGSNPRASTLAAVLEATGHTLQLHRVQEPVDVAQLDAHLALTPAERLRRHAAAVRSIGRLRQAASRVDGR